MNRAWSSFSRNSQNCNGSGGGKACKQRIVRRVTVQASLRYNSVNKGDSKQLSIWSRILHRGSDSGH